MAEEPNTIVDITETFDKKLEALQCHKSQLGQYAKEGLANFMKEIAKRFGKVKRPVMSEAFYRVEFRP